MLRRCAPRGKKGEQCHRRRNRRHRRVHLRGKPTAKPETKVSLPLDRGTLAKNTLKLVFEMDLESEEIRLIDGRALFANRLPANPGRRSPLTCWSH